MGIKGRKNISEKEYDNIKKLFSLGVSRPMVAKITDRSYNTVVNVENSKSWAAYSAYKAENAKRLTDLCRAQSAKKASAQSKVVAMTNINQPAKPFETLLLEAIRDINATLQAKLPEFKAKYLK